MYVWKRGKIDLLNESNKRHLETTWDFDGKKQYRQLIHGQFKQWSCIKLLSSLNSPTSHILCVDFCVSYRNHFFFMRSSTFDVRLHTWMRFNMHNHVVCVFFSHKRNKNTPAVNVNNKRANWKRTLTTAFNQGLSSIELIEPILKHGEHLYI